MAQRARIVLEAAAELAEQGIEAEVIDLRTLRPLDTETIGQSVAKTGRLLIVDETFAPCGIGAEIAADTGVCIWADFMVSSKLRAAASRRPGVTWEQISRVVPTLACPSRSWTILGWIPCRNIRVP